MTTKGVYMAKKSGKIILITECEFYDRDETAEPFSLVTWCEQKGDFPKTLIKKDQFKIFTKIGKL